IVAFPGITVDEGGSVCRQIICCALLQNPAGVCEYNWTTGHKASRILSLISRASRSGGCVTVLQPALVAAGRFEIWHSAAERADAAVRNLSLMLEFQPRVRREPEVRQQLEFQFGDHRSSSECPSGACRRSAAVCPHQTAATVLEPPKCCLPDFGVPAFSS